MRPIVEEDLERVEPGAGRYVEVEVGMVHPVKPPERRNGVEIARWMTSGGKRWRW